MQAACLVALAGLLAASTAAHAMPTLPLSFQAPIQFSPEGDASGLQWLLILFRDPTPTAFELQANGGPLATNYTRLVYGADQPPIVAAFDKTDLPPRSASLPEDYRQTLAFSRPGWASLYVEAETIRLHHARAEGSAFPILSGSRIAGGIPDSVPSAIFRTEDLRTRHDDAGLALRASEVTTVWFSLEAQGVHHTEYSNAQVRCPRSQSVCLDGAAPTNLTAPTPGGRAAFGTVSILEVRAGSGSLAGQGEAAFILAGGQSVTLQENGTARLPLASRTSPCPSHPCLDPQRQTLRVVGNFTFSNLHAPGGADRLTADLSGHFTAANLDETPVDSNLLGEVASVVAVTAGLAIAAALAALFSREITPQNALDNRGRRAIYAAVCAHPGATYRTLMEAAGFSDGVTRHHLRKLEQAGMIVAQRQGTSVRYFENHGRYDKTWRTVAAQREPEMRLILDWLRDHAGCTQQAIVQGVASMRRGAVLRRLERLEAWGLVEVNRQGRTKRYAVCSPGPEPGS